MSLIDHAEHVLGVLSLLFIAGCGAASAFTIVATVGPNWRRIVAAARGVPQDLQPVATRPAQPRKAAA